MRVEVLLSQTQAIFFNALSHLVLRTSARLDTNYSSRKIVLDLCCLFEKLFSQTLRLLYLYERKDETARLINAKKSFLRRELVW